MDHPKVKMTRDQVTLLLQLTEPEDDEQLRLDMLEGETDLFELVSTLLDQIEAYEGDVDALEHQIEDRKRRAGRKERTIEQLRGIIGSLMETAGVRKLPLPQATVFTSSIKGTWKVTDPSLLPKKFLERHLVTKPDRAKIAAAIDKTGELPSGVTMSNGYTSLTIRRT
jgi:hypothetical protein